MTTSKAQGRPRTHADGPEHRTHGHDQERVTPPAVEVEVRHQPETIRVSPAPDIVDRIRTATRLVRLVEDQRREVEAAYARGWRDAGEAMAYTATDAWKAGYNAAVADREAPITDGKGGSP